MKFDCYSTSSFRVFLRTFFSTSACVALWLLTDLYDIAELPEEQRVWSFLINGLVPLFTAGPFFYLLFRRMRGMSVDRLALEKLASTDPLTAVLNRGAFTMLVEAYLEEARAKQTVASYGVLLMVDADHFKRINDTFGHQVGDEALKLIARTISENTRATDLVGRIGGEEFCVFMPATESNEAIVVAERIREQMSARPLVAAGKNATLSVSIGGAGFRGATSFEQIFAKADANLYAAKQAGRNRVNFA